MPVPSSIVDLSTTISSNSPAGTDLIGNTLDEYLRALGGIIKQNSSVGANIASATTITPPASGYYFNVTGTTTITTIGSTNSWDGRLVYLEFNGALTLTHNASTLILPSATNITTVAGDVGCFVQESSGEWRCVSFTGTLTSLKVGRGSLPANTTAIIDRLGNATVPTLAAGTLLTLASAYGTSSDAHLQIIADTNANASIRFGDSATANMARIDYDNIDDTFHAIGNGSFAWSQLADGTLLLAGTTQTLSGASTTAQGYCFPQAGSSAVMSRSGNPVLSIQRTTSDGAAVLFYRQTTNVGSISVTGAATAYNTSSDYRLKPNWERITESGAFIDALIPRHGQWSIDGSYGAGFYAHELQEVSPSSVTGEKDEEDEEGNPIHQAVFYGSPEIIANMVAEMQDMRRRLYELENK